jgi:glycosyltransferase involved in cell wall biosynthesis
MNKRGESLKSTMGESVGSQVGRASRGAWPTTRSPERDAISCVIPTHGRPDLLSRALASVAAQTLRPFEVVVVDDTCCAKTRHVAEEAAAATGLRVRYLPHPKGTGASSSRNIGAHAARGAVLAFLDDDDEWLPGYLDSAAGALARSGRAAAFAGLRFDRRERLRPAASVPLGLTAAAALARNQGVTGSNILVRRNAFFAVGGFDEHLWVSNDKDFLVRLLDRGLGYAVVPEPLVRKVVHSGQRLTERSLRRAEGMRRYYEKYEDRLTARDRRWLRFQARLLAARSAPGRVQRVRALFGLIPLLGPAELRSVGAAAARRAVVLLHPMGEEG